MRQASVAAGGQHAHPTVQVASVVGQENGDQRISELPRELLVPRPGGGPDQRRQADSGPRGGACRGPCSSCSHHRCRESRLPGGRLADNEGHSVSGEGAHQQAVIDCMVVRGGGASEGLLHVLLLVLPRGGVDEGREVYVGDVGSGVYAAAVATQADQLVLLVDRDDKHSVVSKQRQEEVLSVLGAARSDVDAVVLERGRGRGEVDVEAVPRNEGDALQSHLPSESSLHLCCHQLRVPLLDSLGSIAAHPLGQFYAVGDAALSHHEGRQRREVARTTPDVQKRVTWLQVESFQHSVVHMRG
mmetsp:Transcript_6293/g.13899  ORF Transcript_6293/g.13899 Transcript_6293/m.13899 type:complete len:301 (-) Transcript_6293:309-1211(-)